MRTAVCLLVFFSMAADAQACWRWRRCQPRRVYVCPPAEVVPPTVEAKRAVDPNDAPDGWCHITGRVVFEGRNVPKQREIRGSGGAYTEDWVVNQTNYGIANAVVWIVPEPTADQLAQLKDRKIRELQPFKREQGHPGWTQQRDTVVRSDRRTFVPHVTAAQEGAGITFTNASQLPENVKWVSRNNGEMNAVLPPGQSKNLELLAVERFPIEITSAINPWMKAWLRVFDHPYFAVTDSDGKFEIRFVPKGKVRVLVWQETNGMRNGVEGKAGEAFEIPSGRRDLGKLNLKPTE